MAILMNYALACAALLVAAAPGYGSDDPSAEIIKVREAQRKEIEALNSLNPLGQSYGNTTVHDVSGTPAFTGPIERVHRIVSSRPVQAYLRLFSDPKVMGNFNVVVNHPNRMILLYAEGGWVVFMVIFRAWRYSKVKTVSRRLWTWLWTFLLWTFGSSVLVPLIVIGMPYVEFLRSLVESVVGR